MISKSLFVKTIEALQEQYHHDKVCAEKLCELFNCEISGAYNTSYLSNAILNLLREHFPMVDGHCELEHYAYCCNFGKIGEQYESPEELYDRLVLDRKKRYDDAYCGLMLSEETILTYQLREMQRQIRTSPDPNNI